MDRAAMDGDAHGTSLVFSRERTSRRPSASIKNSRTLSGAMVPLFVLGMILIVHGQEEQARQPPERLPAQVAVETFDDPLEQYRARRGAEILELEARVVKNEQALAAGARPALEEQHALADRAEADFVQIKQLLDDGNVSRLDALRLNNDFRRIGPERDRILRNELTSIETQLQYYENTLTSVELELIEDSLADQAEHDAVLEQLAPQRHSQARSDFAELERSYKAVLVRQEVVLTKLVARASETLDQVTRRLRVLEEEYSFIRTHIFWVRDQEPLGLATVQHVGRELKRLVKGMLTLAEESSDRKSWAHPSSEFLMAAVAAVILPLGLFRLRRLLRRRITRALPPSHLHGNQVTPIKVDTSHAIKRT